ncbi:MAG TPA: hypothetical protein VFQ35_00315 [Polyangiaceae bacterium]|nr:hypothetical protein [Polyangiaceae bacterium]
MRWALVASALSAFLLVARVAEARPGSIDLTWNAPIGCPDREQVLASIRELMGESVVASDVAVRIDVARIDARLVLRLALKTEGSSAARTMESTDCEELARGAALVIAFAAGAEPPKPPSTQAPPTPAAKVQVAAPPRAPAMRYDVRVPVQPTAPAPRRGGALAWSALFGLDSGTFPRTSLGGALAARFDVPPFSGGFEALVLLPQDIDTATGGGRFWAAALGLRPCASLSYARLRILPCAVADIEMMVAEGRGVTFREEGVVWFPRFGGGAELGYVFTPKLSVVTGAWVLGAPSRPTFVIDGTVPIHTPGIWSVRWETGLEFAL